VESDDPFAELNIGGYWGGNEDGCEEVRGVCGRKEGLRRMDRSQMMHVESSDEERR
jgi:hypothetical protein